MKMFSLELENMSAENISRWALLLQNIDSPDAFWSGKCLLTFTFVPPRWPMCGQESSTTTATEELQVVTLTLT